MLEFGYCIWLQPSEPSELYDLTDGFEPHISLKTNMKYDEANKICSVSATPLTIKIIDTPYITECEGFYALQYDVEILSGVPQLLSETPHISFIYRYDAHEKTFVKLSNFVVQFDTYTLMCCNSHYTKWFAYLR